MGRSWEISKTNNRYTSGVTYDAAGNITADPRFRNLLYGYDANGRQNYTALANGSSPTTAIFDGAGQRVAEKAGGGLSIMVYDAGGKLAAEYAQVTPPATANIQYVTKNYQGSTSVVTDNGGNVMSRHDYLPFGEEIGAGVGSRTTGKAFNQPDSVRQKYAGMETDTATGMAHTLWRKQDNWSGRWTSPDPYGGSMTTADPQSFNRYTYCDNDPVNRVDPIGLYLADIGVYQTGDPSMASPDWTAQKAKQKWTHYSQPPPAATNPGSLLHEVLHINLSGGSQTGSAGNTGGPQQSPPSSTPTQTNGGNLLAEGNLLADESEMGNSSPQDAAPQNAPSVTIRDAITRHHVEDVDYQCNGTKPAGACTGTQAIFMFAHHSDGTNWMASGAVLALYGDMWITTRRFPYKGRRPRDQSVVDAQTAEAHEMNVHITPARESVMQLIHNFLGRSFQSEKELHTEGVKVQKQVSDLFGRTLRETQRRETSQ